jgi:cytochrome b561
MRLLLERLANPLHLLIALLVLWLVASSPWIGMYDRMPDEPGFFNIGHVIAGLAVLAMTLVYGLTCTLGGRWRLYFPWLAGDVAAIGRDIAGIFRGERPMSEGGGLFAAIEGLLLLAVLVTALTGAVWFVTQDSAAAEPWRQAHVLAVRGAIVLTLLHIVSVVLHLLDFMRE